MATAGEAAKHIIMGLSRFTELLDSGVITRAATKGYDLDAVREQYILYQRKIASGRADLKKPGNLDLAVERAKLVEQQTETAAFKLAVSRGEYVLIKDVARDVGDVFNVIRERILAREGKLSDAVAMRDRTECARIIHIDTIESLNELRDPATFGQPTGGDTAAAGDILTASGSDSD